MNTLSFSNPLRRFRHRLVLNTRFLDVRHKSHTFTSVNDNNAIQRIYVINLDRKPDRWSHVKKELNRIQERSGDPLMSITRRFSAIDALYLNEIIDNKILITNYSLADQLRVQPNPKIKIDAKSKAKSINMTPQEVAIALSHIKVWQLIANSEIPYTLILEDDVYFRHGFAKNLDSVWNKIIDTSDLDLLYLSFDDVNSKESLIGNPIEPLRKPINGIWQASGYVLSRKGAHKLLNLLPAYGPIDLWLNLKFDKINVLMTRQPIIDQRVDTPSTNSYSIMPILSQLGAYTHDKPLINRSKKLLGPIFAYGEPGSGLSALATALSMLGYTCCSDIVELPQQEHDNLIKNRTDRIFNAYINVGSLNDELINQVAKIYPKARFICTTPNESHIPSIILDRTLSLSRKYDDKWDALSKFLKIEHSAMPYPNCNDLGQRNTIKHYEELNSNVVCRQLKFDISPWIISSKKWHGINYITKRKPDPKIILLWDGDTMDNSEYWDFRDDTFPSNLSLFRPRNASILSSGAIKLILRKQKTLVRSFTSAAIVTKQKYLFGKFSAEIKPSNVSGVITGLFLHRNGPHQEIDIEFLGRDTTKILINVFYNPGVEGTKLEFGYRGTPVLINLGFDAAKKFHKYEIEWHENIIRWLVDGFIVHERVMWGPTPIPNLPMEFNINLWNSRSKELAGKLDESGIPAHTLVKSIAIRAQ